MHKQREWRNELEKMKIGNVVGSLSVESKTLRASLVPITQRTLEQVNCGIFPQAARILTYTYVWLLLICALFTKRQPEGFKEPLLA